MRMMITCGLVGFPPICEEYSSMLLTHQQPAKTNHNLSARIVVLWPYVDVITYMSWVKTRQNCLKPHWHCSIEILMKTWIFLFVYLSLSSLIYQRSPYFFARSACLEGALHSSTSHQQLTDCPVCLHVVQSTSSHAWLCIAVVVHIHTTKGREDEAEKKKWLWWWTDGLWWWWR